jgi:hypothetical protein
MQNLPFVAQLSATVRKTDFGDTTFESKSEIKISALLRALRTSDANLMRGVWMNFATTGSQPQIQHSSLVFSVMELETELGRFRDERTFFNRHSEPGRTSLFNDPLSK